MRIGQRREVVTVQEVTTAPDPVTNEPIETWGTWRELAADVEIRPGKEFFDQGQRYAEAVARFTFNFGDVIGLTDEMRIVFEGKTYDIKSILPMLPLRQDTIVTGSETK